MTIEMIYDKLIFRNITTDEANKLLQTKENKSLINSFIHRNMYTKEKMNESELNKLMALVNVLQIIYNSGTESCVDDSDYDTLQEMLINEGVPRLTGSVDLSDKQKVSHSFTQLRGTLDKVYYLFPNDIRVNPSRKYLDEWKNSTEKLYEKNCGKKINLDNEKVILTPKFDGCSVELNIDKNGKMTWMSRGDTEKNKAVDLTYIMKQFNDLYSSYNNGIKCGLKFEVMVSEKAKDDINEMFIDANYKSSRSIVSSILNSDEPDFRVKYLHPILLRVIKEGEEIESIPSELINGYPSEICNLSDRETIKEFAYKNKYVEHNGHKFRTDGVVITLINPEVQKVLGRDKNINNFEVAFKHTEEYAYSKVRYIEFYTSEFGYITPVVVVEDVKLKGNTINHISLSNKERFDELKLAKGDTVKILYDVIPYLTLDDKCYRSGKQPISFVNRCPSCGELLNLNQVQVKCENNNCECRVIGRISNYCSTLRMKNIGYNSIQSLYKDGLLKHGIRSLYKLKKKKLDIEMLDGFGKIKTNKIIKEIESKRRIKDYEFFGAYGIEGLSTTSFQTIFNKIPYHTFIDYIRNKSQFDTLKRVMSEISGFGEKKIDLILSYFKNNDNIKELLKTIDELQIIETYSENNNSKGIIVFSGFRDNNVKEFYENLGYNVTDNWTNKASALVIPYEGYDSSKVEKANNHGIKIIVKGDKI